MYDLRQTLADITPRAATVTLLRFDDAVARYERETGRTMEGPHRETIIAMLRAIVAEGTRLDAANGP
jgi:hypothetical protein